MHLIEFSKLLHRKSHPHDTLALLPHSSSKIAQFKRLHKYSEPQLVQAASLDNRKSNKPAALAPPRLLSPRGYLPVYVGDDETKYLVKAKHLNNPLIAELLERSAEEHGFSQNGALRIWCDAEVFESVLASAAASTKRSRGRITCRALPGRYIYFRFDSP